MRPSEFRLRLLLLLGAVLVGPVAAQTSSPGRAYVDAELEAALERDGAVKALVLLDARAVAGVIASRDRQGLFRDARGRFRASLPRPGCTFDFGFKRSPVCGVTLTSRVALNELAASGMVTAIGTDEAGGGTLDESRQVVQADRVIEELGVTGDGIVVAVLDTGVNTQHPDLAEAVIHQHHFLNKGTDVGTGAEDDNEHGSNIASILSSRGTQSPQGIAPNVMIVVVKVLDKDSRGWVSDWVRGVDYIVDLHEKAIVGEEGGVLIDVLNMSLAADDPFEEVCDDTLNPVFRAFGEACRSAADLGIVVFGASGNNSRTDSLGSPGCYSSVISVGSVLDTVPDLISGFSNRSSFLDVVAPGEVVEGIGLRDEMSTLAGTSQATAHAAAVACLVLEVQPDLSPVEVRELLKRTGVTVEDTRTGMSFPRIDAFEAVQAAVRIELDVLFRRGDCNDDEGVNIADAVRLLLGLFRGVELADDCPGACDTDDDGVLAVDDAVGLLRFLFARGTPPVTPFQDCGIDPTPDELSCPSSQCE